MYFFVGMPKWKCYKKGKLPITLTLASLSNIPMVSIFDFVGQQKSLTHLVEQPNLLFLDVIYVSQKITK